MTIARLAAPLAAVLVLILSSGAFAFDCPNRFAQAEEAIEKVQTEMEGMMDKMSKEDMALVHALLDDAKMLLEGAKHNHEKPQGAYDHARAIAKATAARGYAEAADILHWNYMKKQ